MSRLPNLGELTKVGRSIMVGSVLLAGPALIVLSIGTALIALIPLGLAAIAVSLFIRLSNSDLGDWGLEQFQHFAQSLSQS